MLLNHLRTNHGLLMLVGVRMLKYLAMRWSVFTRDHASPS